MYGRYRGDIGGRLLPRVPFRQAGVPSNPNPNPNPNPDPDPDPDPNPDPRAQAAPPNEPEAHGGVLLAARTLLGLSKAAPDASP